MGVSPEVIETVVQDSSLSSWKLLN